MRNGVGAAPKCAAKENKKGKKKKELEAAMRRVSVAGVWLYLVLCVLRTSVIC